MTRAHTTAQASPPPLHAAAFTFVVAADVMPPIVEMCGTVRSFLAKPARSEHEQRAVELIVEEWAINLAKHGCADRQRHVATMTLTDLGYSIGIRLEDDCPAFDPMTYEPPKLDVDLETRQTGGLGVHLIRAMVEQLRYRREDGKNIWEMVRRIDTP